MSASSSQPQSSHSPQPDLPRAYSRLLAEMPRLRAEVVAPDGAETWVGDAAREALSDASFLGDRVNAGRSMFPMPEVDDDTRFQVQLWWYSLCGSWFGPAVASIVVMGEAPRAEWAATRMFARDGYWLGFTADGFDGCDNMDADAVRAYGAALGRMAEPVVEALSEGFGVRPAPLWAIVADGVAGAAVAAGNELMLPWVGAAVGAWLAEGLGNVARVPGPRFVDVADGVVTQTDMEAAADGEEPEDFDVVTHLERSSCCMIYHCPDADLCVSCPRRPAEERRALWAGEY